MGRTSQTRWKMSWQSWAADSLDSSHPSSFSFFEPILTSSHCSSVSLHIVSFRIIAVRSDWKVLQSSPASSFLGITRLRHGQAGDSHWRPSSWFAPFLDSVQPSSHLYSSFFAYRSLTFSSRFLLLLDVISGDLHSIHHHHHHHLASPHLISSHLISVSVSHFARIVLCFTRCCTLISLVFFLLLFDNRKHPLMILFLFDVFFFIVVGHFCYRSWLFGLDFNGCSLSYLFLSFFISRYRTKMIPM